MRALATVLLAMLVACGPSVAAFPSRISSPITVCLELPADQLPAARAAVSAWDNVLHSWRPVIAVDGSHADCTKLVRVTDKGLSEVPSALGWCDCYGCKGVYLRRGFYEIDLTGILEHELGHSFGAQHVIGTLMDPNYNAGLYQCPDRTTVAQVAAWNHVELSDLKWCRD